jgi:hypothetical protein
MKCPHVPTGIVGLRRRSLPLTKSNRWTPCVDIFFIISGQYVSRVGNPFANFRIARDGGEKTTAKRDSGEAVKSIHVFDPGKHAGRQTLMPIKSRCAKASEDDSNKKAARCIHGR